MQLTIGKTDDFPVSGDGRSPNWTAAEWHSLRRAGSGTADYRTRFKVLYSDSGIYFLVYCQDRILHCTLTEDNADLYNEDVVEVFLWPDETQTLYFEYELSPLNRELPILVPNCRGTFHGWLPWHYEGERRAQHATSVRGGEKRSMAQVQGWSGEFFFPFILYEGLGNMPPASGTLWRANVCRLDYDTQPRSHWTWCPEVGDEFHDFEHFGTLRFA
jgi:hypothetical protein